MIKSCEPEAKKNLKLLNLVNLNHTRIETIEFREPQS